MRITIAAVGKWKAGPEKALFEEYRKRLKWPMALKEVEERRPLPAPQMKLREAELLRAALPPGKSGDLLMVALDERGKALSSESLAKQISTWQQRGIGGAAFVIGGADGLDESLKKDSGMLLSLGPMTWPHMLVRVMLIEQLYRAQQILAGHPYHRA
ncbi:MAG TPA: 23S rRNA (pseudouridine(1915)-N(3))-methyltransferase RlmH [Verrucomicrobiae bacterium]|nr:23S rRNA (pseudouridine(1915)-N(3))-methyltransferase RlmH [Verrucomicrobiae bacterium]